MENTGWVCLADVLHPSAGHMKGTGGMNMDEKTIRERIQRARALMKAHPEDDPATAGYQTDQEKKLPQPPLVKAAMTDNAIDLPKAFDSLRSQEDFFTVTMKRKSSRVYTQEGISLLHLSYLLWVTQGVKEIRGKSYATLRTVPCGGARHPFECYLLVRRVEGLVPGAYHYLPMTHQLELLTPMEDSDALSNLISESLCDQRWAAKGDVIFYWSFVPYRSEWRYGIYAHRMVMADLGHVGENLYLGCAALGLGTCGIGAYRQSLCDRTFQLDGEEEFIVYSQSVGTIRPEDGQAEKDFYRFVEEQGL